MKRIRRSGMIDSKTEVPDIAYYRSVGKIATMLFCFALGCLVMALIFIASFGWSVMAPYVLSSLAVTIVIPVGYFSWSLVYLENRATLVYPDDDLWFGSDDY